jgi:hypothetical protein
MLEYFGGVVKKAARDHMVMVAIVQWVAWE